MGEKHSAKGIFHPWKNVFVYRLYSRDIFCLADLCKALNIGNTADVSSRIDKDGKLRLNLGLPERPPLFVTEP